MSLELSPEIEIAVREQAAASGISVNDLLAQTFAPIRQETRQETQPQSDAKAHVQALLSAWQAEDNIPVLSTIPTRPGETPTQALFRKWREEDALMSDEEKEAEDKLWHDMEQALMENRMAISTEPSAA